jgi:hypothetical protein
MSLYRVLLRCVVECDGELTVGDPISAFGRPWRVDEVISDEDGESILVCTLLSEVPVEAEPAAGRSG